MARKVLIPVLPTDRFYDAVVAAANVIQSEGGLIVFLFTDVRAPPSRYDDSSGRVDDVVDAIDDRPDPPHLEGWRLQQVEALAEARELLAERGIGPANIEYAFADYAIPRSESIAEEAAAGGYDMVVLPRHFVQPDDTNTEEEPPSAIPAALLELGEVRVLVV
jgi:hypothetical protein